MYYQHYSKHLKETGEFNNETSSILFPQIIKFMYHRKFIQGRLLALLVENDSFDIKDIEETAKLTIDCEGLLHIFNDYSLIPELEGTTVENKKIELSHEDKVEITIKITAMLLSNLSKPSTGLPKSKNALMKKIGSVIKKCKGPSEVNSDNMKKPNWNKQVRFWVFDFLQKINVII